MIRNHWKLISLGNGSRLGTKRFLTFANPPVNMMVMLDAVGKALTMVYGESGGKTWNYSGNWEKRPDVPEALSFLAQGTYASPPSGGRLSLESITVPFNGPSGEPVTQLLLDFESYSMAPWQDALAERLVAATVLKVGDVLRGSFPQQFGPLIDPGQLWSFVLGDWLQRQSVLFPNEMIDLVPARFKGGL